ncbi:hypothetical protein BMR85_028250 [Achromobacter sp. KAs 3-5]|nr:hypothetical protein BMR85_028250 [Achromobacter sp. KAs 3-5]
MMASPGNVKGRVDAFQSCAPQLMFEWKRFNVRKCYIGLRDDHSDVGAGEAHTVFTQVNFKNPNHS